ncbi:MAG: [protein-PII] uridylyltransferase [Gammaproteobacteria bacterium]|jgi:[protein-PII] uridylyltransferase|nr:[protein-PII] uridylyltransferase [Gammaproteobacteria bacterium]MBT5203990.1 [protein-PII] uridylyltransferase [Gammaproteobacteria bacterium]MBT6243812.1 [protein-PII] uridylyltransferase [Gammaproteobacteria bacterium]
MIRLNAADKVINADLASTIIAAKNPISNLKQTITSFRQQLKERFEQGDPIELLIRSQSDFMDHVLQLCWMRFNWDENKSRWRKTRISLIAVGGYGRQELLPHSDIDLLILSERNTLQNHTHNIQSFLTLLWDIGLEVGHSVRSISDSAAAAKQDVTILTALMDSRTLAGEEALLERMTTAISKRKIWPPDRFYTAKLSEQLDRHSKSNHTEFSLEPNIKISPGGLRDIQTILWVAQRHYGTNDLLKLTALGFLKQDEAETLLAAQRFLWHVRFILHMISNRDENRLLFDNQRNLARHLGYQDGDQLAVEQFMQDYYRQAQAVSTINEILLQHFDEQVVGSRTKAVIKPINARFQSYNDFLEVSVESVFHDHPEALLEMFVILGSSPNLKGIRASTIRLARYHATSIDENFRQNSINTKLFLDLLRVEHHLFSQLRRMIRYGILSAYMPEFERVIGQMQFDLFHIYTVDAHTLQVVRNMRRFRYKDQKQKFPIAAHIYQRLPKVELLYIAGLFHDLAKGQGGDHSILGIGLARDFCHRHALGTWDTNLVCWLVENHLLMSTTAQRKDIFDPDIVLEFAQLMGDQRRLDYLYALTVADINATNPTLWNSWRASLLSQLYLATNRLLRNGLENTVDREHYLEQVQSSAIKRLKDKNISIDTVLSLWEGLDDDYFIREPLANIVWQTESIFQHSRPDEPLILIHQEVTRISEEEAATHILIHSTARRSLFHAIATAFERLGLNIVDARIPSTSTARTNYTFDVLESNGRPVGNQPERIKTIKKSLHTSIMAPDQKSFNPRRTSRALKQFSRKTEVSLTNQANVNFTVLEVIAPDRPGLLVVLANTFDDLEIHMLAAKISTLGERVEDVFHIVNHEEQQILDILDQDRVRQTICDALDQHIADLTTR